MNNSESRELTLEATVENLSAVNAFIDDFLDAVGCPGRSHMQLSLVIEEIFVNVASYAYAPNTGKVTVKIAITREPLSAKIIFSDSGKPYNPLEAKEPDIDAPIEERNIGGLGIFLVKKNVDEVNYEFADGKNIFTIFKKL